MLVTWILLFFRELGYISRHWVLALGTWTLGQALLDKVIYKVSLSVGLHLSYSVSMSRSHKSSHWILIGGCCCACRLPCCQNHEPQLPSFHFKLPSSMSSLIARENGIKSTVGVLHALRSYQALLSFAQLLQALWYCLKWKGVSLKIATLLQFVRQALYAHISYTH